MDNGSKLNQEQIDALLKPLDFSRVKKREQAGRQMSYIEGYDAIDTANAIFGFDGWKHRITGGPQTEAAGQIKVKDTAGLDHYIPGYISRAKVEVSIRCIDGEWVSHEDAGHCIPSVSIKQGFTMPSPDSIETAEKGAVTDALKRAFRSLGAQFGNSLYDKDDPNHQSGSGASGGSGGSTYIASIPPPPLPVRTQKCASCGGIATFKSGNKDGKAWAGYFCNAAQTTGCKPSWSKVD